MSLPPPENSRMSKPGLFQQRLNPLPLFHAEHFLDGIAVMRRVQNLDAGNGFQMINHRAAGEQDFRIIKPRIAIGKHARRRSQGSRPRFQVFEIRGNPLLAFARGLLFDGAPGGFQRAKGVVFELHSAVLPANQFLSSVESG